MEYLEKIKKVMEFVSMGATQFAAEIGIGAPALSHILNGRNGASLDVLTKILQRFPNISSDWLILDKGGMQRPVSNSQQASLFESESETSAKSTNYAQNLPITNELETIRNEQKTEFEPQKLGNSQEIIKIIEKEVPASKSVTKVIIYFSDDRYQEFEARK